MVTISISLNLYELLNYKITSNLCSTLVQKKLLWETLSLISHDIEIIMSMNFQHAKTLRRRLFEACDCSGKNINFYLTFHPSLSCNVVHHHFFLVNLQLWHFIKHFLFYMRTRLLEVFFPRSLIIMTESILIT